MVVSLIICLISVGLFVYWFRYTCLLILQAQTLRNYETEVAEANRLGYLEVRRSLESCDQVGEMDRLAATLERDYRLLTYLVRHAADLKLGSYTVEERMLAVDYAVMRAWYAIVKRVAPDHARTALREMSQILGHFANTIGERSTVSLES